MDADLYAAATAGDIDEILRLEEKWDQVTESNETILHLAALSGKADCVVAIVRKFPSLLDKVNVRNETALHLAALSGKAYCVRAILINFTSLMERVNVRNETALHLAAAKGDEKVVKEIIGTSEYTLADEVPPIIGQAKLTWLDERLLHLGRFHYDRSWAERAAPVDFTIKGNVDLDTALHLALKNKHRGVALSIVNAYKDSRQLHSQNRKFETPLYLAAIAGDHDMVRTILSNCKYASVKGPEGRTALHAAVISRDPRTVCEIIEGSPSSQSLYHIADNRGWTVVHYAASLNCERAVDTLIEGIIPNERGVVMAMTIANQETAYHMAASQGHIYVLTTFIKYCPEGSEALDEDGRNILHIAAEQSHSELIQSILYDYPHILAKLINVRDKNGNTPLHLLVMAGCFVPGLINYEEVDNTLKNKDNFTAQDLLYLEEDIIRDQLMIRKAFLDIPVHHRWNLWRKITNSGWNKQLKLWLRKIKSNSRRQTFHESFVQENKRRRKDEKFEIQKTEIMKKEVELYKARTNTQIIVTALIATVTFTVGFTMPGGNYDGGDGNEGLAILSKKTAFKVCMVADTVGLLFSASSLFLYFISSLYQDPHDVSKFIAVSTGFNIVSVVAMMLTFIMGTFVVLSHSGLAVALLVISCLFFLLIFVLLIKLKLDPKGKFKL